LNANEQSSIWQAPDYPDNRFSSFFACALTIWCDSQKSFERVLTAFHANAGSSALHTCKKIDIAVSQ